MKPLDPPAGASTRLHPRNRHSGRYDFASLIECSPELAAFVAPNPYGDDSIDFAHPAAVRALNRALLNRFYGIGHWDIPAGYLCPPIPGRADYLHHLADLLADSGGHGIPRGETVRVLDIGVGANLIYPLIGQSEYGWRFVGSDIDRGALASAQAIIEANTGLRDAIELRLQTLRGAVFEGIVGKGERFDLVMCNPPFHASMDDARNGSARKWRNLGKTASPANAPALNFGGRHTELVCTGGEAGFIRRMVEESAQIPERCQWFTALVSKAEHLPAIYRALEAVGSRSRRPIEMTQGQKKSRIVAWTFLNRRQQALWSNGRQHP